MGDYGSRRRGVRRVRGYLHDCRAAHHPPLVGSHTGAASADECSVIGLQATMETSIDSRSVSSLPAAVLVELRIA